MTIIELIEKLKTETHRRANEKKDTNFAFGIIEEWYVDMLKLNPVRDNDLLDKYYHKINGMIYGLEAAYFITEKEKRELIDDLHWTRYGSHIFE